MTRTTIPGSEIRDGSVQKIDLDTTTPGQAVITKVIPGDGIEIVSSTGVDAGTGNVTLKTAVKITVSATEPVGAVEGDLWVDTN